MAVHSIHFPTPPYLPFCLRHVIRGTGSGIGVELMHVRMHVMRVITEDHSDCAIWSRSVQLRWATRTTPTRDRASWSPRVADDRRHHDEPIRSAQFSLDHVVGCPVAGRVLRSPSIWPVVGCLL